MPKYFLNINIIIINKVHFFSEASGAVVWFSLKADFISQGIFDNVWGQF